MIIHNLRDYLARFRDISLLDSNRRKKALDEHKLIYYCLRDNFKLAEFAQKSILYEAILTPKPGLVDSIDSGVHRDMDIYTFIDSSSNLYRGFYLYSLTRLWF